MRPRDLLFLALAAPWLALHAETITGRVVGVTDGDTLIILDNQHQQHKIRLSRIDAPERAQPFGERSKAALSTLAFDKEATADCPKRDRYGRQVCVVTVQGKDVGLEQVATGMAWWYRQYANEQLPRLALRVLGQGLWDEMNPALPCA